MLSEITRLPPKPRGFKKFEATQIRLDVNDRLTIPVHFEIGGTNETVSVNASGAQLQTESAELSDLIGARQTQALPLNGRVFSQLVMLVPGVVSENGTIGNGVGISSDTTVSINGNQSNSNLWLLDGQNNMDIGSNAQNVVTPPLDALEEFNVLRSNYSAEFGGGTGGVVNVVTKQGTQQFHGTVYEYFRNDKLDANDFFLNQQGQPRNKLRFNNFGYTLGGPFWIPGLYNRDKTKDFFFASYEGRRDVRGNTAQDNVPDARRACRRSLGVGRSQRSGLSNRSERPGDSRADIHCPTLLDRIISWRAYPPAPPIISSYTGGITISMTKPC